MVSLVFGLDHTLYYIVNMLYATIVGGAIGFDREVKSKEAGLKTFILICCSSTLFTLLSFEFGQADPARIAAQIVSGVGFLGTGVVFKDNNRIEGLTTAAYIWTAAALGVLIGVGHGLLAIMLTIGMLLSMKTASAIEKFIHRERS